MKRNLQNEQTGLTEKLKTDHEIIKLENQELLKKAERWESAFYDKSYEAIQMKQQNGQCHERLTFVEGDKQKLIEQVRSLENQLVKADQLKAQVYFIGFTVKTAHCQNGPSQNSPWPKRPM